MTGKKLSDGIITVKLINTLHFIGNEVHAAICNISNNCSLLFWLWFLITLAKLTSLKIELKKKRKEKKRAHGDLFLFYSDYMLNTTLATS